MGKKSKLLLGALLGATAAALLTPLSGKDARKKVKKTLDTNGVDTDAIGDIVESLKKKVLPAESKSKKNKR